MLGAARTAWSAAAWNTGGPLVGTASTTITGNALTIDNMFVRPSRYVDFGTVAALGNFSPSIGITGGPDNIDMTGTGTNSRQQLDALTFRPGTDWLADAAGYLNGGGLTNTYNNNGTPEQRGPNWRTDGDDPETGGIVFSSGGAGTNIRFPGDQFDQYRNRWLTFIAASSDDSADFANWTGGTSPNAYDWAFRLVLLDVSSAQIIGQADGWSFRAAGTIDLTQDWEINGSSDYHLNSSLNLPTEDLSQYDIEFACYQGIMGSTADPADPAVYLDLMGTGFNTLTQGLKPIVGWTFDAAGTAITGTYGTYGYSQDLITWSRLPSGLTSTIQADNNLDPAEAPVFTSF